MAATKAVGGRQHMEEGSATRQESIFASVSTPRIIGYAMERLWVFIIFYSIMFYTRSDDVSVVLQLLYTNLSLSMGVMAVTFLIAAIVLHMLCKVGFLPCKSKPLVYCAGALMAVGALMLVISDLATLQGTVVLVLSAALTGAGSAVFMLCYFESFALSGSKITVLEIALSAGIALLLAFILVMLPPLVADVSILVAPLLSAFLLCKCTEKGTDPSNIGLVIGKKGAFSTETKILIAKALAGALLIGVLEGFYDGFFGYQEQAATLNYDATLFIVGFVVVACLAVVAAAAPHDMLFLIYKAAMVLFVLACALSVFLGTEGIYASAVFFSGYMCFTILLAGTCAEISASFGMGPCIVFGVTFSVLYAGELAGANLNALLITATSISVTTTTCCLICMLILFAIVMFLFSETDLIAIGIGEERTLIEPTAAPDNDAVKKAPIGVEEVAAAIAADYALSAREAEVLPLLLAGRTISRIQDALFISAGTVSTHVRHIYQKTGVSRKQQLLDLGELYAQGKAPAKGQGGGE